MTITLFHPFVPKKAILRELNDTLDSKWIGQSCKVDEFEFFFKNKLGYKYCLFLNSGTSALELAYHLLNLKNKDEVIVPVLDCIAGQTGLLRRNVKIVFSDVSENLLIDPSSVEKKITKNTKAIVAVNLGGMQVDKRIYSLAKDRGIPVITDAAQDIEHSKGDYICYSFQAIKHITTADGGMLVLNNKKDYERAKRLRWFGIDRENKERNKWDSRAITFDIEEAGYKYQPTDVDACFGLAGLTYVDEIVEYRKKLCLEYDKRLENRVKTIWGGSCWLFGIITEKRDAIANHLKRNGIETNLVHLRNDMFKICGGKRLDLPMMNALEKKYLYLPLHHKVTINNVNKICKKILEKC